MYPHAMDEHACRALAMDLQEEPKAEPTAAEREVVALRKELAAVKANASKDMADLGNEVGQAREECERLRRQRDSAERQATALAPRYVQCGPALYDPKSGNFLVDEGIIRQVLDAFHHRDAGALVWRKLEDMFDRTRGLVPGSMKTVTMRDLKVTRDIAGQKVDLLVTDDIATDSPFGNVACDAVREFAAKLDKRSYEALFLQKPALTATKAPPPAALRKPSHYPGVVCEHGFDACPTCDAPKGAPTPGTFPQTDG